MTTYNSENMDQNLISAECPKLFWERRSDLPVLQKFALTVFSIVPHSGAVERLFSRLSLSKTKTRNRMSVKRMRMVAVVRNTLRPPKESKSQLARSAVPEGGILDEVLEPDSDTENNDGDDGLNFTDIFGREQPLQLHHFGQSPLDCFFAFDLPLLQGLFSLETEPINAEPAATAPIVNSDDDEEWDVEDVVA